MSEDVATGEVLVRRYMDREHEAIFARGDFASLFAAWLDHVRLWGREPDGLSAIMMRQALGGAALYLSSRPRDESVAFTLNLDKPDAETAIDLVPHVAKDKELTTVLSNSFGFGGTNASLVFTKTD